MAEGFEVAVGEWLRGTGPESDIVVSSRVRLARNINGFPLKARLSEEDSTILCEHLRKRIEAVNLGANLEYQGLRALDEIQRLVLVERHLISLEHANAEGERGLLADASGSFSLMLNEEDHLRIQLLASGSALSETFHRAMAAERTLESVLNFAFHQRFGYLTSCPTNVGTGMRISVMLHLPALVFTKQIDKVFNSVAKMNLAVRGFYGEGTKALSDFYQISNQVTLGKTPDTLLDDVLRVLPKIVSFEREVRKQVITSDRPVVEDRVWRALGLLRNARLMSSDESFDLLSAVRMGFHVGIAPDLDIHTINRLFMLCQPGHLQAAHGDRALDAKERDVLRANVIRAHLAG